MQAEEETLEILQTSSPGMDTEAETNLYKWNFMAE